MSEFDQLFAAEPPAAPAPPAPTGAVAGSYDELFAADQREEERKRRFAGWLSTTPGVTPEQAAEVNRLSRATGRDPGYIGANLDAVRAQQGRDQVAQHLEAAPPLSSYMQDPTRAKVASDDTDVLSRLFHAMAGRWDLGPTLGSLQARAFGGTGDIEAPEIEAPKWVRALGEGVDEQRLAYLRAIASTPTVVTPTEAAYLKANNLPLPTAEQLKARGITGEQRATLADLEQRTQASAKEREGESFSETAVYGSLRMLPAIGGAVAAGVAGGVAGGPLGTLGAEFAFWKFQTYGAAHKELSELKDENGQPLLTVDEARRAADLGSSLAGGLMLVPGGSALKSIPGVRPAMVRLGVTATAQAMARTTLPRAIGYGVLRYGEGVAGGALLMAAQTATTAAVREIERGQHGQEPDWAKVKDETAQALYHGAVSMLLLAGWAPGREFLRDMHGLRNPAVEASRLDTIVRLAQESKLLQRDPVEARKLFADFTRGDTAAREVHADVEGWDAYWQSKGLDPEEAAARVVGDGGKAYAEAKASGGKLSIPMPDYVAKLAPKGHAEALRGDVTLSQDGLTLNQSSKEAKRVADAMKALPDEPDKMDLGQRAVYDDYFAKARAAGVSKPEAEAVAITTAKTFRVWGERLAVDPLELWRRYELGISRGASPAKGDQRAAAQPETPTRSFALGPRTSRVVTPQKPGGEPIRFDVVEAKDLIPSHSPDSFTPSPGYPEGVQERNYLGQPEEQLKVMQGGKALDPAFVLSDTPSALDGPPLVTGGAKRLVLGGNGRSMMIKRAFAEPAQLAKYREALVAKAEGYGIPRAEVEAMTAPVLVRTVEALTHESAKPDLIAAVRRFNEGMTQQLSPRARAIAEARTLSPATVESIGSLLAAAGDSSLRDVMRDNPKELVAILRRDGIITPQNQTEWLRDNVLTEKAKDRVEALFLGRVLDSEQRFDATAPALLKKIERTVPSLLRVSVVNPALDELGTLRRAVDVLNDAKTRKLSLEDAIAQEGMFGGRADAATVQMARLLADSSPNEVGARFRQWATHAGQDPRQVDMFGGAPTAATARAQLFGTQKPTILERLSQPAFHGTGSDAFTDFDMRRIGSGSGTVQGWGIYAAGKRDLADFYRALLADETIGPDGQHKLGGAVLKVEVPEDHQLLNYDQPLSAQSAEVQKALRDGGLWPKEGDPTGQEFYRGLSEQFGSDKLASLALGDAGVPGLAYRSAMHGGERNFVVWDKSAIAVHERFSQEPPFRFNKEGDRGYIEFTNGAGGKRQFDIRLLANADRSTLAHETFHFLTEVMGDLAKQSPDIAKDFDLLAKGMGYESAAAREAGKVVAHEERATHFWEQYLAEGKAPTAELAPVFARFKNWLRSIYRGLAGVAEQYQARYGEPLGLSDEVRGVFDRMLATEGEIQRAQRETGADQPLPLKLEAKDAANYEQLRVGAADAAQQALLERVIEGQRKENAKWVRDERARFEAEAEARLDAMPEYRALSAAHGELRGIDLPAGFKDLRDLQKVVFPEGVHGVDFDAATELVGPWLVDYLDRQWPGLFAPADGGVHPDALAAVVGAKSGTDLLTSLKDMEPREARVAREGKEALDKAYGGQLVDDPKSLAAAALDSAHSDAQAKAALWELRALAKAIDPVAAARADRVRLTDLQRTAERLVADKRILDLNPERHLAAERGAAKRAFDLAAEGKMPEAYAAKEQQLLSMYLYRAAGEAREQADTIQRKLEQSAQDPWRGALGKADPIYRNAHDALLEAIGVGEQTPKGATAGVQALADFFDLAAKQAQETPAELKELLDVVGAASFASQQGGALGLKGLTIDQAGMVRDAVKNIRHLANQSTEVQLAERRAAFADLKGRLITEGEAALPFKGKHETDRLQEGIVSKALRYPAAFDAAALSPKVILEWLGPSAKGLFDAYIERRNYKEALAAKILAHYEKSWEAMPAEVRSRLHEPIAGLERELPIPDDVNMAGQVSRQWLLMVALNMGNQGNRDRMTRPLGWTEAQVQDVLNKHLSKAEFDFVQSVWDYNDKELWPLVAEKQERKTGLPLEKVEATPLETPFGNYAGGYFPAKYEPRGGISQVGARQEAILQTPSEFYSPSYARATTAKSHTKARIENFANVVNLDFGVIQSHLAQVIHDLAFDEFVRDTSRVLLDKDVQTMMAQRLGDERARQPMAWLQVVANAQAESNSANLGKLQQGIGVIRSAVAMAAMGGSIPVAFGQLAHPLFAAAIGKVGIRHAAPAFVRGFTPEGLQFAVDNFSEAAHRRDHYVSAMRENFGQMAEEGGRTGVGKALEAVRRVSYFAMEAADRITTAQVGLGAYNEALAGGATHEAAVAHANDVIQDVMPTHERAEQSALLRDKGAIGSLLMFHGFLNKVYNLAREQAHEGYLAANDPTVGKFDASVVVAKAAGRILGGLAVGLVGGEYLMGHGREEDESWGDFALRKALTMPAKPIPFAGDLAEGLYQKFLAEHPKRADIRQAPMLALFQSIGNLAGESVDEKKTDSARAWAMVELLLTGLRLPARQVTRTGKYITDVATGDEQPQDALEVAGGLVYGKHKKQASNPATDFRSLLQ